MCFATKNNIYIATQTCKNQDTIPREKSHEEGK